MIIGFLFGLLVYKITGEWQFIYIFGYLFGFAMCGLIYGKLFREPLTKTKLFKETNKTVVELNISSLLKELVTYTDRLLLFPLMGGVTVAVYNAAAIVGKCVSLITNPISGLLLSHLSNDNKKNLKYLKISWIIALSIACGFYFIFLLISKPLLNLLYPQYCNAALEIISYTLIAAMINAIVAMINPFMLRAHNPKIQLFMNLSSLAVYFLAALVMYKMWGLIGFCFAVILAGVIKLLFLIYCSLNYIKLAGGYSQNDNS